MGDWLDESRITSTSYPFIFAELGYRGAGFEKASIYTITSDFKTYSQSDMKEKGGGYITDAQLEGVVPFGRKGSIKIVDPTGSWALKLATVGEQSNSYFGGPGPNIYITFGWKGLKPQGRDSSLLKSLTGFINKVETDITSEGVFTATVYYVEFSSSQIDILKFFKKEDMLNGLPINLFNDGQGGKKDRKTKRKPQDILKKITSDAEHFSVAEVLKNKGISFNFLGADKTKEISQENFPKIRFGDSFEDYLDSVISLIVPTDDVAKNAKQKKRVLSYQKLVPKPSDKPTTENVSLGHGYAVPIKKETKTVITYDWIEDPIEGADKIDANKMSEMRSKMKKGPYFIWRFNGVAQPKISNKRVSSSDKKVIKDWSSDLSSHSYIIHQFADEISKKLSGYTETDWENLEKILSKKGLDKAQKGTVLEQTAEKIQSVGLLGKLFSNIANRFDKRQEMFKTMTEVEQSINKSLPEANSDSLRSVILSNAFKANAIIMGDPTLGTDYAGTETIISTYFSSLDDLAGLLFNRDWILLKTIHIFSEGKYETNCELMGYPDPQKDIQEKEKWDQRRMFRI